MDIIQFIGFIIMMVLSIVLSSKTKKAKKESLDGFEQLDQQMRKIFKEPVEQDEEEEEWEEIEETPAPMPEPTKVIANTDITPPNPVIPNIEPHPKDSVFDLHKDAFVLKKSKPPEGKKILEKLDSLQEAIIIQEIFNKPKGM